MSAETPRRDWRLRAGASVALLVLGLAGTLARATNLPQIDRALSLRQLQQALAGPAPGGAASPQALGLGGMTSADGFLVDSLGGDVILLGRCEPAAPGLHADDLVIALRNAWGAYAEVVANVRHRLPPGCSLEPDPNLNAELADLGSRLRGADSTQTALLLDEWTARCRRPQRVDVWGIPGATRFATTMLRADYGLKALVDGGNPLGLDGFHSLHDATVDAVRAGAARGERVAGPPLIAQRFWFYPGEAEITTAEGLLLIVTCPVLLLTEEQYVSGDAPRDASGPDAPGVPGRLLPGAQSRATPTQLAQAFAEQFSRRYSAIATERPIFAQLEQLFRLVLLSQSMRAHAAFARAGLAPAFLLAEYVPDAVDVPESLPGRPQAEVIRQGGQFEGQPGVSTIRLLSCGGIDIQFDSSRVAEIASSDSALVNLSRAVLDSRGKSTDLIWEIRSTD